MRYLHCYLALFYGPRSNDYYIQAKFNNSMMVMVMMMMMMMTTKPTNEIYCSTHLFQFIGTDVRTVCETEVDQSPLAMIIRTLPLNTGVVHKFPRTTDRCFAKRPRPLFLSPYQSHMTMLPRLSHNLLSIRQTVSN